MEKLTITTMVAMATRITTAVVAAAAAANHAVVASLAAVVSYVVVNHVAANSVLITISTCTTSACITFITSCIITNVPMRVHNRPAANVLNHPSVAADVNSWILSAADALDLVAVELAVDVGVGLSSDASVVSPTRVGTPMSLAISTVTSLQLKMKVVIHTLRIKSNQY